jgi:hypothetical protein
MEKIRGNDAKNVRGSSDNGFVVKAFGTVMLDVPLQLGNGSFLNLSNPLFGHPNPRTNLLEGQWT